MNHGKLAAANLEDLGNALKSVRQVMGLSLSAVAKPAKISPTYVQKLEDGAVKNPSPRVLHRLSGVLNIPYAQLMEFAGYFMPGEQTAARAASGPFAQALEEAHLSMEEQRAVGAFIAYLRDHRPKS